MTAEATMAFEPEDSLWLGVLGRDGELARLTDDEVREKLRGGNFPEALIEEFLASRGAVANPA